MFLYPKSDNPSKTKAGNATNLAKSKKKKKKASLREKRQLFNLEKVEDKMGASHLQGRRWNLSIMQFDRCVGLHGKAI